MFFTEMHDFSYKWRQRNHPPPHIGISKYIKMFLAYRKEAQPPTPHLKKEEQKG